MSQSVIHIGGVKIPLLDYAVSCNAILGIRDSGKTVCGKAIAEQLLDHDIPIIVFDAVGKWRWMKVPGPGPRGRGYKVVVAGGRAPDLALNPHSVGEIVRSAVKEKIPLIIDLYDPNLSKADWRLIVQQSIRIIHYEANGVAHVFLEEAAEYVPQKIMDGNTYAEVEKLARMGGNASVGLTLISPRSQEINKAVLDLAHNLVLGCQIGNRAIDSIGDWVDKLSPDTAKALMTSLPHLKSGQAWVWTRTNPDDPKLEQMQMCRSLHPDRRTPDIALKSAKAVDPEAFVKRLKVAIPKIIEEAKAADPREWAKEKRELQQKIKRLESAKPQMVTETKTKTEIKTVEKRIVIASDITRLEKLHEDMKVPIERIETLLERAHQERSHIAVALTEARELNAANMIAAPIANPSPIPRTVGPAGSSYAKHIVQREPREIASNGNGNLSSLHRQILNGIALLRDIGEPEPTIAQVGAVIGKSHNAGRIRGGFNQVHEMGYAEIAGNKISLTPVGSSEAVALDIRSRADVHSLWYQRLKGNELEFLRVLIDKFPNSVRLSDLGAAIGKDINAGRIRGALNALFEKGLATLNGDSVTASGLLFPSGLD